MKFRTVSTMFSAIRERELQSSEHLRERSITLHGQAFDLEQLCGGNLVMGASGSGKTVSVMNPLALCLAADGSKDTKRKSAIIYFATKGRSHEDFIAALPPERRSDVIHLKDSKNPTPFRLFPARHWKDSKERAAAVEFVLELQRHLANNPDDQGNHKVYWEGLTRSILTTFMEASQGQTKEQREAFCGDPNYGLLYSTDAFSCLLYRIDSFLEAYTNSKGVGTAGEGTETMSFSRWLRSMDTKSQGRVSDLIARLSGKDEHLMSYILSELQGIQTSISTPLTKKLLLGPVEQSDESNSPWTFERVIDEGKILVVDLPVGSVTDPERGTLVALAQRAMQSILRRRDAVSGGGPLNVVRPIVIVADEFHGYLVSKGRSDGLDHFLSRCREFGAIVILATQSIPLLTATYRDVNRCESLLSHVRNLIVGRCLCERSNQWATHFAGLTPVTPRPAYPNWHEDPDLEEFLSSPKRSVPRIGPFELQSLPTGVFIAYETSGRLTRLDARKKDEPL